MGSEDAGELAVLGGRPAYQEVDEKHRTRDEFRALMPGDAPALLDLYDFSRRAASLAEEFAGYPFVEPIDKVNMLLAFLDSRPDLPFTPSLAPGPGGTVKAELRYVPTAAWKSLPPEAVVRLLAMELGVDPTEPPSRGALEIPTDAKGRAAFPVIKRALTKLGDAYKDPQGARPRLLAWAAQLNG